MAKRIPLPNCVRKLQYLRQIGAIPQEAGLYMVDVFHDDWCDIYQARRWGTHLRQDTVIPQ